MFRIGVFAKLGQVSVSALRFYDEMGVLKPHHVDHWTGYRYYSVDQLPRLNRILALKDLGLTIDQITHLLEHDVTAAELRGMLILKQAEIQQRIAGEQQLLARVGARLKLIEEEDRMADIDVVVKSVEAQMVVRGDGVVDSPTTEAIGQGCRAITERVCRLMERDGLKQAGPWTLMYDFDQSPLGESPRDTLRIVMAVPVGAQAGGTVTPTDDGGAILDQLPALATAASTVHHGPYETLPEVYTALGRWIEANGYHATGPCREIYLHGPQDPVTEIQFPIEKGVAGD